MTTTLAHVPSRSRSTPRWRIELAAAAGVSRRAVRPVAPHVDAIGELERLHAMATGPGLREQDQHRLRARLDDMVSTVSRSAIDPDLIRDPDLRRAVLSAREMAQREAAARRQVVEALPDDAGEGEDQEGAASAQEGGGDGDDLPAALERVDDAADALRWGFLLEQELVAMLRPDGELRHVMRGDVAVLERAGWMT